MKRISVLSAVLALIAAAAAGPRPGLAAPMPAGALPHATLHTTLHTLPHATARQAGIGRTRTVQGFTVTIRSVARAREAGAADYVAGRGHVFLLIDVVIRRAGGHGSYYADPQDFHIQTSAGDVIDSDQFGLARELRARHVYQQPVEGLIGFEAPSGDRGLHLLWQPTFDSNPDAQADWLIGAAGRTVSYYH